MKLRGLYAITPEGPGLAEKVAAALEGGIALLQYRRKSLPADLRRTEVAQLLPLCRRHGVP